MSNGYSYRLVRIKWNRMMAEANPNLETMARVDLVARINQLEDSLKAAKAKIPSASEITRSGPSTPRRAQKAFNFAEHPRRKIALKFTYDGSHYNGLEFQKTPTPLPTVEETLWEALVHTRLVDPEAGFDGVGWEKCGRTDRGVSGAGQVVSFWIRSALKKFATAEHASSTTAQASVLPSSSTLPPGEAVVDTPEYDGSGLEGDFGGLSTWDEPSTNNVVPSTHASVKDSESDDDELKYISNLNGILPPTIRVLAWSPVAPEFSARFACRYRHYKYFFVAHGVNIEAMRDGAARLLGEHDFRNLHKLDPAKQLTTFRRRILRAEINPVGDDKANAKMFVFDLVGTAFLYNQVRHIMAILLLIGSGLEAPSLMTSLLNADPASPYPPFRPGEPTPQVVTTKPIYQMADALPLVLWECGYSDGDVTWRNDTGLADAANMKTPQKASANSLYQQLRSAHERSLIQAALNEHYLAAAAKHHPAPPEYLPLLPDGPSVPKGVVFGVPLGAGTQKDSATYIPVLERKRLDHVLVTNERWRSGKGARKAARQADEAGEGGEE